MVDGGWYGVSYEDPFRPRPVRDWIKLAVELEELGIFWLEDFLHPDNFAGYARAAEQGRIDVLQPDLSRCGGLTAGKQIADLATRRQLGCAPHAWLTGLLRAASLHRNAYLMDSLYIEFNTSSASLLNTLTRPKVKLVEGCLPVPEGPGLGVEVDEKMV